MNLTEAWLRENYHDAERVLRENPPAGPLGATSVPQEPTMKRKAAHVKGEPNQTEQRFAEMLKRGGWPWPIEYFLFEWEVLQLTPDMTYCPDYVIFRMDGSIDCVDCKGKHTFEDSIIKAKAATLVYPDRRFYIAALKAGEWHVRQMGVKGLVKFRIPA